MANAPAAAGPDAEGGDARARAALRVVLARGPWRRTGAAGRGSDKARAAAETLRGLCDGGPARGSEELSKRTLGRRAEQHARRVAQALLDLCAASAEEDGYAQAGGAVAQIRHNLAVLQVAADDAALPARTLPLMLLEAARRGDSDLVGVLTGQLDVPILSTDRKGRNVLHMAVGASVGARTDCKVLDTIFKAAGEQNKRASRYMLFEPNKKRRHPAPHRVRLLARRDARGNSPLALAAGIGEWFTHNHLLYGENGHESTKGRFEVLELFSELACDVARVKWSGRGSWACGQDVYLDARDRTEREAFIEQLDAVATAAHVDSLMRGFGITAQCDNSTNVAARLGQMRPRLSELPSNDVEYDWDRFVIVLHSATRLSHQNLNVIIGELGDAARFLPPPGKLNIMQINHPGLSISDAVLCGESRFRACPYLQALTGECKEADDVGEEDEEQCAADAKTEKEQLEAMDRAVMSLARPIEVIKKGWHNAAELKAILEKEVRDYYDYDCNMANKFLLERLHDDVAAERVATVGVLVECFGAIAVPRIDVMVGMGRVEVLDAMVSRGWLDLSARLDCGVTPAAADTGAPAEPLTTLACGHTVSTREAFKIFGVSRSRPTMQPSAACPSCGADVPAPAQLPPSGAARAEFARRVRSCGWLDDLRTDVSVGTAMLAFAAGTSSLRALEWLIAKGVEQISPFSSRARNLMHVAAARLQPLALRWLLQHDSSSISELSAEGHAPVHVALIALGGDGGPGLRSRELAVELLLSRNPLPFDVHGDDWFAFASKRKVAPKLVKAEQRHRKRTAMLEELRYLLENKAPMGDITKLLDDDAALLDDSCECLSPVATDEQQDAWYNLLLWFGSNALDGQFLRGISCNLAAAAIRLGRPDFLDWLYSSYGRSLFFKRTVERCLRACSDPASFEHVVSQHDREPLKDELIRLDRQFTDLVTIGASVERLLEVSAASSAVSKKLSKMRTTVRAAACDFSCFSEVYVDTPALFNTLSQHAADSGHWHILRHMLDKLTDHEERVKAAKGILFAGHNVCLPAVSILQPLWEWLRAHEIDPHSLKQGETDRMTRIGTPLFEHLVSDWIFSCSAFGTTNADHASARAARALEAVCFAALQPTSSDEISLGELFCKGWSKLAISMNFIASEKKNASIRGASQQQLWQVSASAFATGLARVIRTLVADAGVNPLEQHSIDRVFLGEQLGMTGTGCITDYMLLAGEVGAPAVQWLAESGGVDRLVLTQMREQHQDGEAERAKKLSEHFSN